MSLDVLVVDQDVKLAKLYRRFLADHGFSAKTAASGLECLDMVRRLSPGVLILDHDLRWNDAQGVVACLHEDDASLPVILTTWKQEKTQELVTPPVVACLRKFFPLPALLNAIQLASSRSSGMRRVTRFENSTTRPSDPKAKRHEASCR